MAVRKGRDTVILSARPRVLASAAVGGKKEGDGPLGKLFDAVFEDGMMGAESWEKAESALQREALTRTLNKAGLSPSQLNYLFAGDLLNQNMATTFGVRDMSLPLLGQFGACSTMAQTLAMAGIFVDGGAADLCAAVTSSHFCAAERQFRFPLEYGAQRTPSAQWTATAAGAVIVGMGGCGAHISAVCAGRVVDLGITDANHMGAAMAPAAADTLCRFLRDTQTAPSDYDLIATGDLASIGAGLMRELCAERGVPLGDNYHDCGVLLYDSKKQDVHAGGSGCGCSAAVLCADILPRMARGELSRVLFVGTGALLSTTSSQQGESIPGIAHLVFLER